ncbi:hypothetical protein [Accumulibacter sp.]|uniref:hypothetical protein n=1 Tax=Accumulibacter sp. TaxID=2053492 RepID=UPI0025D4AD67|nr:hypothetical protein [Accumulibacter sp.]MCM8625755.1 hypothetical protein [Accumulibacter sp.]
MNGKSLRKFGTLEPSAASRNTGLPRSRAIIASATHQGDSIQCRLQSATTPRHMRSFW